MCVVPIIRSRFRFPPLTPHPYPGFKLDKSPDALRKGLTAAGLPNLFIPSADSFLEIDALPILGTGKLDLRGIKSLALEKTGAEPAAAK